ncbi:plasma membrane fusion protein prm1 [Cladophialophora chaetospira]|uniref:Plasma membrane fusion protein PRM1 n=1 Tax=Cladophialophora chaetospira TaxID=386627 RepID=A0AA39CHN7_9EURO|nr:plasma membrane fusion protein prm1 [Cladophialophora chaetospira]
MSAPSAFAAGAPPSMPAGSHEIRDYYSDQDPPRSLPHTAPSVTPYLGLRARLSQIWINRWTVLLLLVLVRSLIAISGINDNLGSARSKALSACSAVESTGSAIASMPHYMSAGVNELTAAGIEKSVNGLMQMSTLSVTAIEEIVVFVIGMMTNTYLCLITFAVTGSLHSVIGALTSAQNGLNNLTKNLGGDLSGAVSTFEDAYNSFLGKLGSFIALGQTIDKPAPLNLTAEVNSLKNLKLPPNLDADLLKLNGSIPTFDQVKNFTENLIRLPFEEVKLLMNEYMGNYTFDRSVFPVPQKEQLTFCSDNNGINSFFDDMADLTALAAKIFIGVLVTLAILVMIPMAWREIKRYRKMQQRSQMINSNAKDPMDVVYLVSRPYTSSAGVKLSNSVQSQRKKELVRWVVAYATSDSALFVLSLALAGLFTCLCQVILVHSMQKEVPNLTNQVADFSDKVIASLNNASEQWAIGTNAAILATNKDINQNMLGWVNTSTTAINDTLVAFVDETTKVLNATFGGTILYDPIMEVLNCLVLLKIQGVEKGLTWVHDHAHVDFPTLANDTFSTGAVASLANSSSNPSDSILASPGSAASDEISAAITTLVNKLYDGIRTEAIISTVILLVWVAIVLGAIIRALSLWYGRDKVRGEGGAAAYPSGPASNDFRSDNQDRYAGFVDVPMNNMRKDGSLSPAPEYTPPEKSDAREDDYQDSKLGFSGSHHSQQPNYDSKQGFI